MSLKVSSQIWLVRERLFTDGAPIWFLSCVSPHVSFQQPRSWEDLSTLATKVTRAVRSQMHGVSRHGHINLEIWFFATHFQIWIHTLLHSGHFLALLSSGERCVCLENNILVLRETPKLEIPRIRRIFGQHMMISNFDIQDMLYLCLAKLEDVE